jgi:NAD(P)-dependent dehydrogenase (short-subunit alcohol dehydrogenase family)
VKRSKRFRQQEGEMAQLEGKTALVTGGTSGIGYATARAFADEGAKVFITGRTQQRVDAAAASLGSGVIGVASDVTNTEDLDRLVGVIRDAGAGLDIVFRHSDGRRRLDATRRENMCGGG